MSDKNSCYKFEYLVRTLSRTKRKDYENYIVNAVYNRVDNSGLKPVTQYFVKSSDGKRAYIDLYFPQINLGVECDESYHRTQAGEDTARRVWISEVLNVKNDAPYKEHRILTDRSRSLQEIEEEIYVVVSEIKDRIEEAKLKGEFSENWASENCPEEYYAGREWLHVEDDVGFRTNKDIVNILFGGNYRGSLQSGGFTPKVFRERLDEEHMLWLPDLMRAKKDGWRNVLSDDRLKIHECHEKGGKSLSEGDKAKRVTFVNEANHETGIERYRFVGVFELRKGHTDRDRYYDRINDYFSLEPFKSSTIS